MKKPPRSPQTSPSNSPRGERRETYHPPLGGQRGAPLFFMAKGHIFYRKVFFHFIMCGSSGTKSDVAVAAGRYEPVHISTDVTNTSRLPKADTHNEMYFYLINNTGFYE